MFLQINKNSDNIRVLKIANTIKSILSDAFLKGKINVNARTAYFVNFRKNSKL